MLEIINAADERLVKYAYTIRTISLDHIIARTQPIMDAPTRVLATLDHQEPDRVPYFESTFTNNAIARHFSVQSRNIGPFLKLVRFLPFRNAIMLGAMSRKVILDRVMLGIARFYKAAGIDLMPTLSVLFPRKIVKDGFIDEFGRHMHFEYYKDGTEVIGYVGGQFAGFEDYESWELPDPAWAARENSFLAGFSAQEKLGNQVMAMAGITGIMEVTWEGFGFEKFARLLIHRAEAKKIFDDKGKFAVELTKILAEKGAKVILVFDDYGFKNGLFMSIKNYRDLVFPWLAEVCRAAHRRGCKIVLHSDGDLSTIIDDLVDGCKIDALNPIEPTTANKAYDIFEIKRKYGDRLTLVGNVSPTMLATGTIAEIEAYTSRLIRECAPGGGYILASGHSINPAVTLDRWQAMLRIRDTIGQYPIKS